MVALLELCAGLRQKLKRAWNRAKYCRRWAACGSQACKGFTCTTTRALSEWQRISLPALHLTTTLREELLEGIRGEGNVTNRAVGGNLEVVRPLGEGYKMSRAKRAENFFNYFSLSYR